ncbi:MAG: hypothetical protein NT062_23280 [Proteobacteria bacterium]|nr:hypothetical protein [Pseudomonadota bacterium]
MSMHRRSVKRREVIHAPRTWIRALLEQEPDDGELSRTRSEVQRCQLRIRTTVQGVDALRVGVVRAHGLAFADQFS